jgi:hypothetical protein
MPACNKCTIGEISFFMLALAFNANPLQTQHGLLAKNVQVKKIHLHEVTEEVTSLLWNDILCRYKMTS